MVENGAMRTETFPVGIVGVGIAEQTRQVRIGEPPPLPPNAELAVIGKPYPRDNGRAKVIGAIRFTVDVALPGMLFARILRSPHAHAEVRAIDTTAAERDPRVRAIVRAVALGDPVHSVVRYVGQPVVAVAATSMAAAEESLRLVRVDYKPLPFVVDLDEARRPESAKVYDPGTAPGGSAGELVAQTGLPLDGNVRGPAQAGRGDVAQGFAAADLVVEGEYRTQVQTHCCMEPHGLVADWRPDGLTVHISTQFTTGVRRELANAFDLPLDKVRVVVGGMGGGFGSKSTLGNYGRLAVALSRQAGAPVRLTLTRPEEQVDSGNRPATHQRIRIGARRDGTLTAISVESHGTAGVGLNAGIGNFAQSLYGCPNFASAQYDVFINAGPGTAMRGPGNTPGAWGMELAIDELAERLGMDPLALRERIDPSPVRREERRIGAEKIGWSRRHEAGAVPGPIKRGMVVRDRRQGFGQLRFGGNEGRHGIGHKGKCALVQIRARRSDERVDIVGIGGERAIEKAARLRHIVRGPTFVKTSLTLKIEVHRVRVRRSLGASRLCGDELRVQRACQPRHDFVLHVEEIGERLVEPLGPEMIAGFAVDELDIDAHPVPAALDAAFEDVADVQLAADLL